MRKLNVMKDDFVPYSNEIILECKLAHEANLKSQGLSERSYNLQSRALRYYDLLLLYNDVKSVHDVSELADEKNANTWQYMNSAQMRVKRYLEEKGRTK